MTTLRELSDKLADVLGVDGETVRAHVRTLRAAGLLPDPMTAEGGDVARQSIEDFGWRQNS